MKMIGLIAKLGGLYHLILKDKYEHVSSINNIYVCTFTNSALWHFRSGHLSPTRMQSLQNNFPFVVVDKKAICDICHFSKHKKLPYHLSFNKSKHLFGILHFDVWGPLAVKSYHGHLLMILVNRHGSF